MNTRIWNMGFWYCYACPCIKSIVFSSVDYGCGTRYASSAHTPYCTSEIWICYRASASYYFVDSESLDWKFSWRDRFLQGTLIYCLTVVWSYGLHIFNVLFCCAGLKVAGVCLSLAWTSNCQGALFFFSVSS